MVLGVWVREEEAEIVVLEGVDRSEGMLSLAGF
jgi:hypothetical protein